MSWADGWKHIDEITIDGKLYHFIIKKNSEMVVSYFLRVVEGAWNVPVHSIIAEEGFNEATMEPSKLLEITLGKINIKLAAYFKGDVDTTWCGRMEELLSNLKIGSDGTLR